MYLIATSSILFLSLDVSVPSPPCIEFPLFIGLDFLNSLAPLAYISDSMKS
jgi:hypothetical protein